MKIVGLEDDEPFWETFVEELKSEIPGAEIVWIRTEFEFWERIPDFVKSPPDIFLLDVMVKWADASPNPPPAPPEVAKESYYRAGLRCRDRLRESESTADVPVVLFTVLERSDVVGAITALPPNTFFVDKTGDTKEVIRAITSLTGSRRTGQGQMN